MNQDGPASKLFTPLKFLFTESLAEIKQKNLSAAMQECLSFAPQGDFASWGIPFQLDGMVFLQDQVVELPLVCMKTHWLVFMHTSDLLPQRAESGDFLQPFRGEGGLGDHAADYVICYSDGTEERVEIRRRFQVGAFQRRWGENCFKSVMHFKPHPVRGGQEQMAESWGYSQTRVDAVQDQAWINWLWAWENPYPDKEIKGLRFEPVSGSLLISGVSAGDVGSNPLRWESRQKALWRLGENPVFKPNLDLMGNLQQIQLDMGHIISALPRSIYPDAEWQISFNNQIPRIAEDEIILEYTAHPDAAFHLQDGSNITVCEVQQREAHQKLTPIPPAKQRVLIRVIDKITRIKAAVKLHIHGGWGEYLAPVDRHRIINDAWFEDYSVDFKHRGLHSTTYINGETTVDLPLGDVYFEISKGFEINPLRKKLEILVDTTEVVFELESVLPWRQKGWVTADTHVHFLSPISALLEGSAEGVNVVNLLASQWGELMTNVGDFDGKTTWGAKDAGGDGEYLVRVGTENRQHVLGHISLLGYQGRIIAPMTTGGVDESALGDPVETLLTEWAHQCKAQGGLVVLPHFPNPRAEHAASIISGEVDALEMTSWGNLYAGIDPYSLVDWYRYLNCGYLVAAVGGTDKMSADTAVGTVRTYARIPSDRPFTYESWMDSVRKAETFVSYGPLLEFSVAGQPMGSTLSYSNTGATLDVEWEAASVTIPMTVVELIVNGEIFEQKKVDPSHDYGHCSLRIDRSAWIALRVRAQYPGKSEIVAAHSSPVMVRVAGSEMMSAADAVTILEQIEGAMAFLDVLGTRADEIAYKRMRLVLTSAHRSLHNRMHIAGYFHDHSVVEDHPEHH